MTPDELRHIRKDTLGLNQSDFARLLGVSRSTIVSWEKGRTAIPHLRADIVRRMGEEAKRRDDREQWARSLLALAVVGSFTLILEALFSQPDEQP